MQIKQDETMVMLTAAVHTWVSDTGAHEWDTVIVVASPGSASEKQARTTAEFVEGFSDEIMADEVGKLPRAGLYVLNLLLSASAGTGAITKLWSAWRPVTEQESHVCARVAAGEDEGEDGMEVPRVLH